MPSYRVTVQPRGEADTARNDVGRADSYADARRLVQRHAEGQGATLGAWRWTSVADEPSHAWCSTNDGHLMYYVQRIGD